MVIRPKRDEARSAQTGVTLGNFFRLLVGFAVIGLGLLYLFPS
jgi:hypothetical protein